MVPSNAVLTDPSIARIAFLRSVSERVGAQMARSGITYRALAAATGIPRTTLHRRFMHGEFSVGELHAIAEALGCSIHDFIPGAKA